MRKFYSVNMLTYATVDHFSFLSYNRCELRPLFLLFLLLICKSCLRQIGFSFHSIQWPLVLLVTILSHWEPSLENLMLTDWILAGVQVHFGHVRTSSNHHLSVFERFFKRQFAKLFTQFFLFQCLILWPACALFLMVRWWLSIAFRLIYDGESTDIGSYTFLF